MEAASDPEPPDYPYLPLGRDHGQEGGQQPASDEVLDVVPQREDAPAMTWSGYALGPQDALEDLDMTGGSVLSLKVTGRQSNGLVTVLEGVVLSGGPPLHLHEAEDEVVVCLEGELSYQVGEERGALQPGGLLWFPRQVPHAVANLSDAPLRFLTVVTPSGIEDFFRAQRDYLAEVSNGHPFDPAAFGSVPGHETRTVVGPPLS